MKKEDYDSLLRRVDKLEREMKEVKSHTQKEEPVFNQIEAEALNSKPKEKEIKQVRKISPPIEVKSTPSVAKKPQKAVPKERKEIDFEKLLGTWLSRVFMVILIFGVLWGLKIGMDNGYITNPVRIIMGYVATLVLGLVGFRYYATKNKGFGLTLLGGLIALGILTTFAAHNLYGYFNPLIAFVIGLAYIAFGFISSYKTKSEVLTLFSILGGFLLPFLLEGSNAGPLQLVSYILILFLASFYFSLREGHKYTFYVSFILFHLTFFWYNLLTWGSVDETLFVGAVLVQHLFILLMYVKKKISTRVFSEILLYTNFVFAIGWIKLLSTEQEMLIYGLLALLYVALTVNAFREKENFLKGILSAVSVFAIGLFVLSFNFENESVYLLLLLLNGAVGLWVGMQFKSIRTLITSSIVYGLSLVTVLFDTRIEGLFTLEHASWLMTFATLGVLFYAAYNYLPKNFKVSMKAIDISLIGVQILVAVYLTSLTQSLLIDQTIPYQSENHIFALVILLVLIASYSLHKWKHGLYVAYASIIGLFLVGVVLLSSTTVIKLLEGYFFFNLSVQLLFIGFLTYLFFQIKEGKTFHSFKEKLSTNKMAVVMQLVYFVFLNKLYLETADNFNFDHDYIYLIHTLLLFTFAFVSISIGRKKEWKHVKILGAVLILACVFKLFFIDLVTISLVIRALLFIIVGVAGLFYSRSLFKNK